MCHEVVHQPNSTIPVYKVKLKWTRGPLQVVHHNMLRPCTFVPRNHKAVTEPTTVVVEDDWWAPPPTADLDLLNNIRKWIPQVKRMRGV